MGKARYTIEEIKEKAIPIAKKYGVKTLWLFGSYARGDADSESDVDFLIDEGNGKIKSLMPYFGFVGDLENIFQCHIDVVMTGSSDKEFLTEISNDEVLLYEQETA